jgi:hypothetical protein
MKIFSRKTFCMKIFSRMTFYRMKFSTTSSRLAFCKMTSSRITFSGMIFSRKTFSRTPHSITELIKMTSRRITFRRKRLSKMTLSRMTLSRMTLSRMTLSRMTLSRMLVSRMSLSRMIISRFVVITTFEIRFKLLFQSLYSATSSVIMPNSKNAAFVQNDVSTGRTISFHVFRIYLLPNYSDRTVTDKVAFFSSKVYSGQ